MAEFMREALDLFNIRNNSHGKANETASNSQKQRSTVQTPMVANSQQDARLNTPPETTGASARHQMPPTAQMVPPQALHKRNLFESFSNLGNSITKFIYPTITIGPAIASLVLVAISTIAISTKMIIVLLLLFIIFVYYIQFKKWNLSSTSSGGGGDTTTASTSSTTTTTTANNSTPASVNRIVYGGGNAAGSGNSSTEEVDSMMMKPPRSNNHVHDLYGNVGEGGRKYHAGPNRNHSINLDIPAPVVGQQAMDIDEDNAAATGPVFISNDNNNYNNNNTSLDREVAMLMVPSSSSSTVATTNTNKRAKIADGGGSGFDKKLL